MKKEVNDAHIDIPVLLVLAAGINVIGNSSQYRAATLAPASLTAPMHYTQIITGAMVAYGVWGEVPSFNLVLGSLLIMVTGVYLVRSASDKG